MHDPELIFRELDLKEGDRFLDMGCGTGDYTLEAARIVGATGRIYAVDIAEWLIAGLEERAAALGLGNITAVVGDITSPLPVEDEWIDLCFLCTVLHILDPVEDGKILFPEIRRVLKPGGRLAIIECKKERQSFGPPIHMRLSPEEIAEAVRPYGFRKKGLVDLGYNYLIQCTVP
ncbi:MAG: methyltransferase domain-containing protein [Deltaproteobacteria bacterium]|nr:methyltransferase domain-containing protein [Deltaproteobacteria bacterium]